MKLSIAMATYNGQRYLDAQLESLQAQTRRPDEVVITDDASTDRTPEILDRFAREAPFPVQVHRNARQLGYIQNFEKAVGLCAGDVILLADQDDVWRAAKLQRHEAAYLAQPEVGAVFSDGAVVDPNLAPLGFGLWQHVGLNARREAMFRSGRGLDLFVKRGFCYGILLSFRAGFRDVLLPFPTNFSHDDWITLVMSAFAPLGLIAEPLVDYRQHAAQTIGVGLFAKPGTDAQAGTRAVAIGDSHYGFNTALARMRTFEDRIAGFESRLFRKDCRAVIAGRRAYLERRKKIAAGGDVARAVGIVRDLASGGYFRYGTFPKSDLRDDVSGFGPLR